MPARIGADLSVRIRVGDTGTKCEVARPGAKPVRVRSTLDRLQLAELRRYLSRDLGDFRNALGNQCDQRGNRAGLEKALRILHRRGFRLFSDLFGGDLAPKVWEEFATIIAAARKAGRYALIDLNLPAPDCLPIEFLVLDPRTPDRIEGDRDLEETAAAFLGFSAVVRRQLPPWQLGANGGASQTEEVPVIENVPKLPLKLFYCDELSGARSEAEFFETAKAQFELDGPWPEGRIEGQDAVVEFARCLWNPQRTFRGECRDRPDQIHHFACHFVLNEHDTEESYLRFQARESPPVDVHLGDLGDELLRLQLAPAGPNCQRRPLVFANACRTSAIQPGAAASFPKLILRNGNAGFVGTETDIPDEVASEFAKRLYQNLLHGNTLGDSVMNAKIELLRLFHNPLGILYVFYAEPDTRVRKPVEI